MGAHIHTNKPHMHTLKTNKHTHTNTHRAVAQKVDLLITGGSAGVDSKRPGEAVSTSLAAEISHIKNTESNILHQLGDLR